MLEILVITLSDRAYKGEYPDLSGPEIKKIIAESQVDAHVRLELIPDERGALLMELKQNSHCNWIITTGGTGIGPRDITPQVSEEFCDRSVPGISELLRSESLKETPYAVFSRGFCGIKGTCIVVNFPGSVKGAAFCTRLLLPLFEHGRRMAAGKGH